MTKYISIIPIKPHYGTPYLQKHDQSFFEFLGKIPRLSINPNFIKNTYKFPVMRWFLQKNSGIIATEQSSVAVRDFLSEYNPSRRWCGNENLRLGVDSRHGVSENRFTIIYVGVMEVSETIVPEIILRTAEKIRELTKPSVIYLYNLKTGISSQVTSFKLCLVSNCEKGETERRIYLNVECEIPYDILIYTEQEWEAHSKDSQSFAHKIMHTGRLLYEKTSR